MVSELLKMCLPLNALLARALSVQIVRGPPLERDDILLEAKLVVSDILRVFSNDPGALPLLGIQRDLGEILLMNTDLETMDVLLRVNTLISNGLEHLPDVESMPVEIFMFITTVVTQEEIRQKILSFLCILSKVMGDRDTNVYLEPFFKLDHAIAKTLAGKEKDNKLESLCQLSFLLTEFMVTDYPDDSTEWIVQLNHLASRAMVEKFKDPKHLFRANNILSQAMRKLADKPFFGELIELNCILSTVFLLEEDATKYNQLIGWKLLLNVVMQDVLFDEEVKHFTKSARETEKEEKELARLTTKIALVTQERDEIRAKARVMRKEIGELTKERDEIRKEIVELLDENIALNSENWAMKRDKRMEEFFAQDFPDYIEQALLDEEEKESEVGENREGSRETSEETEILNLSEEKSLEEPVQLRQVVKEEVKSEATEEGEKVTPAIAGAASGEKNVTNEKAGPSKAHGMGQSFKKRSSKKKGAGGNTGPGSSRGHRSKKK